MVNVRDLKELPAAIEVNIDGQVRRMRTGFTTGACATAATKAALIAWREKRQISEVEIKLPTGHNVKFAVKRCEFDERSATSSVVKDAGDDPDVTHRAEITVTVRPGTGSGLKFRAGHGVGTVTKEGLGLKVGEPAINPIPRKMMVEVANEILGPDIELGMEIEISVPGGEEMAKKTMNPRLGIIGGISILGKTGVVLPYSTSAWMATIPQAIQVAVAQNCRTIVATTGDTSEDFAKAVLGLPEHAFIDMGEFVGFTLKQAAKRGIRKVIFAGMVGKLSKIAAGSFQTHAAASAVDIGMLTRMAASCGASKDQLEELSKANTARHFGEMLIKLRLESVFDQLCEVVRKRCMQYAEEKMDVGCILFDFDGKVLGRANVSIPEIPL